MSSVSTKVSSSGASIIVSNSFMAPKLSSFDCDGFNRVHGDEIVRVGMIENLIWKGNRFQHMLYTFRSVSRAIPMTVN